MSKISRSLIRIAAGVGVFAFATSFALSAEIISDAPPSPQVISSRRATKFLIHNQTPHYPPIAKMNYIQGKVSVQTWVDDSGEVREAHVVRGHPFLAMAALNAIRSWLFKPAHSRQGPASFMTYVEVNFSLQSRRFGEFPARPEADLNRQVLPPELAIEIANKENSRTVRLRILVGPDGHVMDSVPLTASQRNLNDARHVVANWIFRPARWGAIAVPWYLEVDVPIESLPAALPDSAHADLRSDRGNAR
ncbi:MAG: energy transducer TonB [Acidobacteria bacterium]|nr:energy transducer TonB [Acidobacteriota bacterium]